MLTPCRLQPLVPWGVLSLFQSSLQEVHHQTTCQGIKDPGLGADAFPKAPQEDLQSGLEAPSQLGVCVCVCVCVCLQWGEGHRKQKNRDSRALTESSL